MESEKKNPGDSSRDLSYLFFFSGEDGLFHMKEFRTTLIYPLLGVDEKPLNICHKKVIAKQGSQKNCQEDEYWWNMSGT